nr:tyrosine-protein phosphatase [Lacticaseibacillus thailandensis]
MPHERVLTIPNAINLRELGGYPTTGGRTVAWHKVLRSGTLSYLDGVGEQQLADYGVTTVVDLRSDTEVSMSPDKLLAGTNYQHLSVYPLSGEQSFWDKLKHRQPPRPQSWDLGDAYIEMLVDRHALHAYRQLFDLLLANTTPGHALVFHCAAGKDRTGVGAMMIEGLLGVPTQSCVRITS